MSPWKFPLFALALTTLVVGGLHVEQAFASPQAAAAEEAATPPSSAAGQGEFLDEKKLDEVEKMTPEQRNAFFEKRREKWKSMSKEDIKAYKEKRKAWFDSLPPERQAALKERIGKMSAQRREERKKWLDSLSPEEKKKFFEERKAEMQRRMDGMTPEEREKFMKNHPNAGKGHGMGGKYGRLRHGMDGKPGASADETGGAAPDGAESGTGTPEPESAPAQ
jgi:hypothetical protein